MEKLYFKSEEDAQKVLIALTDLIHKDGFVSLGDLKNLSGIKTTFIDHKIGWTVLTDVKILQVSEKYLIDLPDPEHL